MRRALLALAVAAGLAIGTVVPVSALGETSITLNCNDGTSVPLLVDTDTLNSLTASVQAMTLYPTGLSCSIIQNPLALFGHVALAAAPGQNPFIVAGGRWLVNTTCETLFPPGPIPAEPAPIPAFIGGGTLARVPGSWSYGPSAQPTPTTIFVNIAVNVHQADNGTFFGTLNETIPTQSPPNCGGATFREVHFTSRPLCLATTFVTTTEKKAVVTSTVTEVTPPGATFPGVTDSTVEFSFIDNGNPPQPTDQLQGPPEAPDAASLQCTTATGANPDNFLQNGNISVRIPQ